MKRVFWIGVLVMAALLMVNGLSVAQDEDVVLIEFNDGERGIGGLLPDGWSEAAPGIHMRLQSQLDATVTFQGVEEDTPLQEVIDDLLPQLLIDALPDSVGTMEANGFAWTLYQVDVDAPGMPLVVDFALAERDGNSYVVVLQTSPEEHDALHETVFVPVVEAFKLVDIAPPEDVPYVQEDLTFENGDITLAGTLSLPPTEGQHPAVVLISGSGAQDRDESLQPITQLKPFQIIADHLTRQGIAVLRYDDRGVGDSTGDYYSATSADLATDAEAAMAYLLTREDINPQQIGLFGHSEGGLIAAIVAADNADVAFVVSMGGTGARGDEVLLLQNRLILEAAEATEDEIADQLAFVEDLIALSIAGDMAGLETLYTDQFVEALADLPEEERASINDVDAFIASAIEDQLLLHESWYPFFFQYDPAEDWARTSAPVLALFGGKDVQVNAEQNALPLEAALQDNPDVTVVIIPDANHLFQDAETGGLEEYGTLAQEFHPDFLPTVTDWLLQRVDVVE